MKGYFEFAGAKCANSTVTMNLKSLNQRQRKITFGSGIALAIFLVITGIVILRGCNPSNPNSPANPNLTASSKSSKESDLNSSGQINPKTILNVPKSNKSSLKEEPQVHQIVPFEQNTQSLPLQPQKGLSSIREESLEESSY